MDTTQQKQTELKSLGYNGINGGEIEADSLVEESMSDTCVKQTKGHNSNQAGYSNIANNCQTEGNSLVDDTYSDTGLKETVQQQPEATNSQFHYTENRTQEEQHCGSLSTSSYPSPETSLSETEPTVERRSENIALLIITEKLEKLIQQFQIYSTSTEKQFELLMEKVEQNGSRINELTKIVDIRNQTQIQNYTLHIKNKSEGIKGHHGKLSFSENDDRTLANCELGVKFLSEIADKLGEEWYRLGIQLGYELEELDHLKQDYHTAHERNLRLLVNWGHKEGNTPNKLTLLKNALGKVERNDLVYRLDRNLFYGNDDVYTKI